MKINHKKLTKNIFLFIMVLTLPYVSTAETKNKKNEIKNKNFELGTKSISNQFLIRLKSHVNIDEINANLSSRNLKILNQIEASLKGKIVRKIQNTDLFVFQSSNETKDEDTRLKELNENSFVERVEPNFRYFTLGDPAYQSLKALSDPSFKNQWSLKNFGQTDGSQNGKDGVDINWEPAFLQVPDASSVLVGIIDTGMDLNHEDLKENIWINQKEFLGLPGVDDDLNGVVDDIQGANFVDPLNPTNNPDDDNGHGSHCAGVIGAIQNEKGIIGINPRIRMVPIKFLGGSGGGSLEGAIRSIDYGIKIGVQILSNSWGGGGYSQFLMEAIQRAERAGILFVAAAGNDGVDNDDTPHYPSSYSVSNVLSVAALDNRGELANFSNIGQLSVDLGAPGVNIFSTYKGNKYAYLSGTSMATPHVTGVAAMVLASQPQMSFSELKTRLKSTVQPFPNLHGKLNSPGMVSAYNAVMNIVPPPLANDPFNWNMRPVNYENSPQPYKPNSKDFFEVVVPGASEFAVFFEYLDTERDYDRLEFYDNNNNFLFKVSGARKGLMSPTIKGNYVKVVFVSDVSVEKRGYKISQIYYK